MAGVLAERRHVNECRFFSLYKKKGPTWREKFYRRCAERLKTSREIEVNRHRPTLCSPHSSSELNSVRNVMKEEWRLLFGDEFPEFDTSGFEETKLLEEIEKELRYEEELIIQEFEKVSLAEEAEINYNFELASILCPVCQIAHLTRDGASISCPCGAKIHNDKLSLTELQSKFINVVQEHNSFCELELNFICYSGQFVISCPNCHLRQTIS